MQQARSDFGFPKALRLLNAAQYRAVFSGTELRAAHPNLLIIARRNDLSHPRLGLVVAKKHVRLAVGRNRIKRLVRENFRLQQSGLPAVDAVVLARPGVAALSNDELVKLLDKLWRKLSRRADEPASADGANGRRKPRRPDGKSRKKAP
ncbi:ribonuclease P protein component [Microbulbifer flavimaris]|uniref:Ribonuclease P protein component n=1 Tax=Microbulbifer flavimaris TaxID=1781068 RepID=A0ABX4I136_9GAMM|nr:MULTISPECIES: ribonuclease P protein component [Microbulbifer]PCO05284.1 ribonuclease P protein component [Microbulbifer flavimaris]